MSDGDRLPAKKDVARALLLKGTVFVHLDPRGDDCIVPQWLRRQPQLVLQLGLDMPVPIPDLRVDDSGVFGTLSFNRTPFTCSVPWEAVFAVVGDDGRGMVWPASMPDEIASEVAREARRAGLGDIEETDRRRRRARAKRAGTGTGPTATSRQDDSRDSEAPPAPAPRASSRPVLGVIDGNGGRSRGFGAERDTGRRSRPPYLRVVK